MMAATRTAEDRHDPENDFVKYAQLLEMVKGLEPYGYYLDKDLKVSLECAML